MDSTTSLSKGCFAFAPKAKYKGRKRNSVRDEFEDIKTLPGVSVYSSIVEDIEQRLLDINKTISDEVLHELVQFVSTSSKSEIAIPTAVFLTGVNLPDHQILFQDLSDRLKSEVTPHVSVLLSSECSTIKNTIEQLTSQFLRCATAPLDSQEDSDSETEDVFDDVKRTNCTMPNLVEWYENINNEHSSPKKRKSHSTPQKLVIIIPDFEGFSSKVLQDVILILSGYLDSLPLVLVIGVATSVKALQSSLPHRITSRMNVQMFQSQQSVHFLNNTVNEIFLSWENSGRCPFLLGPKMFKFLTEVFLYYDFSVHGFIQGVKYCLIEHFHNNPLSKLCCPPDQLEDFVRRLNKDDLNNLGEIKSFRTYVENLPSTKAGKILQSERVFKKTVLELLQSLQTYKNTFLLSVWLLHTLVQGLPESPLENKVRDVYVEVMSGSITEHPGFIRSFELLNMTSKQELLQKVDEVISILQACGQLEEVKEKLKTLRCLVSNAGQNAKSPMSSPSKRESFEICSDRKHFREKLLAKSKRIENEFEKARSELLNYLKSIFKEYLVSPSTLPLHEIVLIDNISTKRHIVGAPRAALHVALNDPHHYLQCECCKITDGGEILPTMPDICIAYKLHLESQALINMYDWLQSFIAVVSPEDVDRDERKVDPALQARFTRAVSELQFLGFIKASKKKTDHVARMTWGGTL